MWYAVVACSADPPPPSPSRPLPPPPSHAYPRRALRRPFRPAQANTFAWYWPALSGVANAPLVIWLQGGPGGSSMFGLFTELGPYRVNADGATVTPNPFTWCTNYSCLFVDNPRGTGFSYTSPGTLCADWQCYGADLDNMLRQVRRRHE